MSPEEKPAKNTEGEKPQSSAKESSKETPKSEAKDKAETPKSTTPALPDLKPGMTIRVHQKVTEGDKERVQVFEGMIIALKHGRGVNGTMTLRRMASGIGVERIYPLHSPLIVKIDVVKKARVRRSKLYYLRDSQARSPKETIVSTGK
ncbi:MAG: 50S ribosomal protein L19 [bacterium]|nr:50S ribosomal protein L19 [bacterium]